MTPLGTALSKLIWAQMHHAGQPTIEERAEAVEVALRALIQKELVIRNLIVERDPVD